MRSYPSPRRQSRLCFRRGARIDHAAHDNDLVGHLGDILAYHDTVRYLKEWVTEQNKHTPTVLISVSDHETGGLALGRQLGDAYPEYAWYVASSPLGGSLRTCSEHRYPDALLNAKHSTPWLGAQIAANPDVSREWLREEMYVKGLGITDVTEEELDVLWPHRADPYRSNRILADAVRLSLVVRFAVKLMRVADLEKGAGWVVDCWAFGCRRESVRVRLQLDWLDGQRREHGRRSTYRQPDGPPPGS